MVRIETIQEHIAHITKFDEIEYIQTASEHSRNTAKYTSENLKVIKLESVGYLTGLIHDMGKFCGKFDEYIRKSADGANVKKGSVNHTFSGVIYLMERYHNTSDFSRKLTSEIVAWAIGSHHGQFDIIDLENNSGFEHRMYYDKEQICYDEAINDFIAECANTDEIDTLFDKAAEEVKSIFEIIKTDYKKYMGQNGLKITIQYSFLGFLARLVLSALIDADRRDTNEFCCQQKHTYITADTELWIKQLEFFNRKLNKMSCDTEINKARKYISDKSAEFAVNTGGVYRISVPTGAGKTLATLRFALEHAAKNDKSRLIFVIPLLSVLEQNAKVISDYILDSKTILTEHHSNVVRSETEDGELDNYELLSESFSSPVLITTLVQLLNTLFAVKTTSIRRMKSLCNSVIVIDEVQSVPYKTLYMFNMAINFLVNFCGATVVLSSATQPCFETLDYPIKLYADCDIVPFNEEIFKVFKRTETVDLSSEPKNIEQLSDFSYKIIEEKSSLLIICNTKNSAKELFYQLKNLNSDDIYKLYHLSTSMCTQHRIDTLAAINKSLALGEKIICVSTQLVEAGVDFSFEVCIRIKAGIDNITQAAGRCNRSNDYGYICTVYIVSLQDEKLSMLPDIIKSQQAFDVLHEIYAKNPIAYNNDMLSTKSVNDYYHRLLRYEYDKDTFRYAVKNEKLFSLISHNDLHNRAGSVTNKYILKQSFKSAGDMFKVFDDNTEDIIVPYNETAREIIADLCSQKAKFDIVYLKEKIEQAKPYTIQVYAQKFRKLCDDGVIFKTSEDKHFTALMDGYYSDEIGLNDGNSIGLFF